MQISSIQPLPPTTYAEAAPATAEPLPVPKPLVPAPAMRPTLQDSIDIVNALMLMRQV